MPDPPSKDSSSQDPSSEASSSEEESRARVGVFARAPAEPDFQLDPARGSAVDERRGVEVRRRSGGGHGSGHALWVGPAWRLEGGEAIPGDPGGETEEIRREIATPAGPGGVRVAVIDIKGEEEPGSWGPRLGAGRTRQVDADVWAAHEAMGYRVVSAKERRRANAWDQ